MSHLDEPASPPVEPQLDLRRHPRSDTEPIRLRDWLHITRQESCPVCGNTDTRPSHRHPWYATLLGLHQRRCRVCRTLFAHFRPGEALATLILVALLGGVAMEAARRIQARLTAAPTATPVKGSGALPPPVMR